MGWVLAAAAWLGVPPGRLQASRAGPSCCWRPAGPAALARPERSLFGRAAPEGLVPRALRNAQYRHHRRHREGQGPVQGPPRAHPGLQHLPAQGARRRRHAPAAAAALRRPLAPRCRDPAPPEHLRRAGCRATRSGWTTCRPMCSRGSRRCVGGGWVVAGGWAEPGLLHACMQDLPCQAAA